MAQRGVNKVILVGNTGKDPDVRSMPNGNQVAGVTIATGETWKDQSGQQQDRTEWHNVVFFGKLAEIVGQYVKKGAKLYVEGSLRTRKWQDKNGQDRYTTEVVANEMQMLDRAGGDSGQGQRPQGQQRPQQRQSEPEPQYGAAPGFDFDDEIPF